MVFFRKFPLIQPYMLVQHRSTVSEIDFLSLVSSSIYVDLEGGKLGWGQINILPLPHSPFFPPNENLIFVCGQGRVRCRVSHLLNLHVMTQYLPIWTKGELRQETFALYIIITLDHNEYQSYSTTQYSNLFGAILRKISESMHLWFVFFLFIFLHC